MGIKIDTTHFSGFTRCCDLHDICYDTCNNDRNQCDEDFKSCLDNECLLTGLGNRLPKEQLDSCQSSADLMYSGTYALGCMAYKEAQRNACLCNGRTLTYILMYVATATGLLLTFPFLLVFLLFGSGGTPLSSVLPSFASLEWDNHFHWASLESHKDVAQQGI